MAFIEKKDPVILNIKLTSLGRELLSNGNLTFNYYAIGDSEIDYAFNTSVGLSAFDANILRPADKNPSLLSFIPQNYSGSPYNVIPTGQVSSYNVTNTVLPIGFFTSGGTAFITDTNHVKQPDAMVRMNTVTGGKTLQLRKAPTYGPNVNEPAVGDLLLVKWATTTNTTGYTINVNKPTPYLFYQIVSKTAGTSLAANNLSVTVDRNLPNFTGSALTSVAGAMIYYNTINYSGASLLNNYSTDYLSESVMVFLQNCQCPTVVFPYWNMSIVFTEAIAGIPTSGRTIAQYNDVGYGGFVSYIQNQAPVYKKLGVIHYTNSSPANVYAEGFYTSTPKLNIPTIMWYKSNTPTLGVVLSAIGNSKLLTGTTKSLNTTYYDLADPSGNIVGKVFTDLKVFVIEDQELLFAMSYKSNRSWTLPDYVATTNTITVLPTPPPPIVTTWTTPVVTGINVSLLSQAYCHSTSGGWQQFTNGTTHIENNVVNAGYCVLAQAIPLPTGHGGGGSLSVCDTVTHAVLPPGAGSTPGSGGGPGTIFSMCLVGINNSNSFCFYGTLS